MLITLGRHPRQRLRRVVRKVVGVTGLVLLVVLLVYTAFRRWTYLAPPDDRAGVSTLNVHFEAGDQGPRWIAGDCWLERRDGIWRMHLRGNPRTIGRARGLLTQRLFSALDQQLWLRLHRGAEEGISSWWREQRLRWRLRGVTEGFLPAQLVELAAFSRSVVDPNGLSEEPFQRLADYHVRWLRAQALDAKPLAMSAIFAGHNAQGSFDSMVAGMSTDLRQGPLFDREKLLVVVRPEGRLPWVGLTWPGNVGALAGVNARRIFVGVAPTRTDDDTEAGVPPVMVVRELLERSESLPQAVALLRQLHVSEPAAYLLADGVRHEASVVERSPRRTVVRAASRGVVAVTNHFISEAFKTDAANDQWRRYTPSGLRYRRLAQLLGRKRRHLRPQVALAILRDRAGVDDQPLALGRDQALDSLHETCGIVVDLTDLALWVSTGPALIGAFAAIDLKPLFGVPVVAGAGLQPLPADSIENSAQLMVYRQAREELDFARALRRNGAINAAIAHARRAVMAAPELPQAQVLLADMLWENDDAEAAKQHYRAFVDSGSAYGAAAERARTRLLTD